MGVYIKGMEMPKEGFVEILIRDDGTVQQTGQSYRIDGTDYYTPYVGKMPKIFTAVPVPPHGRLIDADALINDYSRTWTTYDLQRIANAPTIIPASEEAE